MANLSNLLPPGNVITTSGGTISGNLSISGNNTTTGIVESTSGGFKFPNGTTQAVASKLELISVANASAASSVDFTGLSSTYSEYIIVCSGFYAGAAGSALNLRTSSNNGSTWDSGASDYLYGSVYNTNNSNLLTNTTGSQIPITATTALNTSAAANHARIIITNAGISRYASIESTAGATVTGTNMYQTRTVGFRMSTTAINGVRLYATSTNLTGTFYLYGVRV
jgi:hypothetical protein